MNDEKMNEQDKKILQNRLKERRLFLNMTYQNLADKTGISKSTLQRYETGGIQKLPYDKIFVLSEALNVTPDYFTDLTKNYTYSKASIQVNRSKYLNDREEFKKKSLGKITSSLIMQNYKLKVKDHGSLGGLVAIKGSKLWYIDFIFLDLNDNTIQMHQFFTIFGRLALCNRSITKYSIIINHPSLVDQIINNIKPIHLNIKCSIIILTNDGFDELKLN